MTHWSLKEIKTGESCEPPLKVVLYYYIKAS